MRTRRSQWHRHKGWQRRWRGRWTTQRSLGKSPLRLIDPAPQQIRVEPVFQRDRSNRYADSLARSYHLRLELLAVPLPATTLGECFRFDSVHVSAYSLGGHDTPKSFTPTQDGLPGRLRFKPSRPDQRNQGLTSNACKAFSIWGGFFAPRFASQDGWLSGEPRGIVRGREASVPFRSLGLRPSLGVDASGSVSVMSCYRAAHTYWTRRSGRFSGGGVDRRPESAVVQFAVPQRAAAQPRTAASLTARRPPVRCSLRSHRC